jgi:hypothetical protein
LFESRRVRGGIGSVPILHSHRDRAERTSASSARSRLPRRRSTSGACNSRCDCSGVSQLPTRTPSFLTPLTRRMPGEVRTQQSAICRLASESANCPKAQIDGAGRQATTLQVNAISELDPGQAAATLSWARAVPAFLSASLPSVAALLDRRPIMARARRRVRFAWLLHGSGRILPFGATSVWYPIVVGYFVCRAATHHRSLPSL